MLIQNDEQIQYITDNVWGVQVVQQAKMVNQKDAKTMELVVPILATSSPFLIGYLI